MSTAYDACTTALHRMLTRDHKQRPSITQILMSRAVVEKSKEVGVPLPRDILDGAAKHDERGPWCC